MADEPADPAIDLIPADAKCYIGLVLGSFTMKWGPYDGLTTGKFMEEVLARDPSGKHPIFFSVECGAPADPVAELFASFGPEPGVCRVCRCTETTACAIEVPGHGQQSERHCGWVPGTGQTLCDAPACVAADAETPPSPGARSDAE